MERQNEKREEESESSKLVKELKIIYDKKKLENDAEQTTRESKVSKLFFYSLLVITIGVIFICHLSLWMVVIVLGILLLCWDIKEFISSSLQDQNLKIRFVDEIKSGCKILKLEINEEVIVVDMEDIDHIVELEKYHFSFQKDYSTAIKVPEFYLNDNTLLMPYWDIQNIETSRITSGRGGSADL